MRIARTARRQFLISAENSSRGTLHITLFDLRGRIMVEHQKSANQAVLDGAALPPGIYILHVESDGEYHSSKLLME
ncbi:T9SS type A sorting domain-containing protein [Dyadobacter sandarakinus]|uniref:T9SS type A sorting domain-containing protein n=1 Tax=Dyadobacter sandarakinus TaxID=2747268 RepID=UPI0035B5865D